MRDLFSGCVYVHMYVSVTLRNVNLRSCLRSQASLIRALHENVNEKCFLVIKDREDSAVRPSQRIWQSCVQKRVLSAETSVECSRRMETLRK